MVNTRVMHVEVCYCFSMSYLVSQSTDESLTKITELCYDQVTKIIRKHTVVYISDQYFPPKGLTLASDGSYRDSALYYTSDEWLCSIIFDACILVSTIYRIDIHFVIKIADFGLSEDVYAKNYFRQTGSDKSTKLPVKWMAPESLTDGIFSEKSDVVSFFLVRLSTSFHAMKVLPVCMCTAWPLLPAL